MLEDMLLLDTTIIIFIKDIQSHRIESKRKQGSHSFSKETIIPGDNHGNTLVRNTMEYRDCWKMSNKGPGLEI
jgi:hypothetical protein